MSRVGKMPISIPQNVNVVISSTDITIKGVLGTLTQKIHQLINVRQEQNFLILHPIETSHKANAMFGTLRALLANMVLGVSNGFDRKLILVGVGFRAQIQNNKLVLQIGFSHFVSKDIPIGIRVECPTQTEIIIKGYDRQKVGQFAAEIRNIRPPECYKGKGIRYFGEKVLIKETKKK
jgi:large subunit ribosomal protein L6